MPQTFNQNARFTNTVALEGPVNGDGFEDAVLALVTEGTTGSSVNGENSLPSAVEGGETPLAGVGVSVINTPVQTLNITLDGVLVDVLEADGFATIPLALFLQDRVVTILGAILDVQLTLDGVGLINTSTISASVGTAPTTSSVLAGLAINLVEPEAVTPTDLVGSALFGWILEPSLVVYPTVAGDGVHLNISAPTETGEDGQITIDGRVSVSFIDIGSVESVPK